MLLIKSDKLYQINKGYQYNNYDSMTSIGEGPRITRLTAVPNKPIAIMLQ